MFCRRTKTLRRILDTLEEISDQIADLTLRFPFDAPVRSQIVFEGETVADISVSDTNAPLTATASFFDGKGNAVPPQGVPVWSTSDASVASVDASADPSGLTAVVTVGAVGAASVAVASDNTDGTVISASATVTVTAGAPASADISFS